MILVDKLSSRSSNISKDHALNPDNCKIRIWGKKRNYFLWRILSWGNNGRSKGEGLINSGLGSSVNCCSIAEYSSAVVSDWYTNSDTFITSFFIVFCFHTWHNIVLDLNFPLHNKNNTSHWGFGIQILLFFVAVWSWFLLFSVFPLFLFLVSPVEKFLGNHGGFHG